MAHSNYHRLYSHNMTNQTSGKGDLKSTISHTRLYRLTAIRSGNGIT